MSFAPLIATGTKVWLDGVEPDDIEFNHARVTIDVTLMFTERHYLAPRSAIWRGVQRRRDGLNHFKSAYCIFVSRVDVYTQKHVPNLSSAS